MFFNFFVANNYIEEDKLNDELVLTEERVSNYYLDILEKIADNHEDKETKE